MEDAIAIALEAGSDGVGALLDRPIPGPDRSGRTCRERGVLDVFTSSSIRRTGAHSGRRTVAMGDDHLERCCVDLGSVDRGPQALHRADPLLLHRRGGPLDRGVHVVVGVHGPSVAPACDIGVHRREAHRERSRGAGERPRRLPAVSGFVDECQLNVRGGDGGAGCISFRREAHVSSGGGDVWLVADRNVASLLAFKDHPHRRAPNGVHGQGKKKHGANADDTIVHVPEGTVVLDQDRMVLADLVHHGDRWLAAEGGRGGKGNARFLSNIRRAPTFAEQGEIGQERWLNLELKLMALVGFPNVGKSTLISRISAAKPKIADYPFTTLEPNLGVVRLDDGFEMVVADIPGLIEGAAEGRGLGHQFLRHVERARVLVLLLDLAGGLDGTTPQSPAEQAQILLHELGAYRPELLDRPRILVGSRADLVPDLVVEGERPVVDGVELDCVISAVTGAGLPRLVGLMADAVRAERETEPEIDGFMVHRPVPEGIRIDREDDGSFRVIGRSAERAVALSDLTNLEALDFAQARLKKLGVDKALARAGAKEGDTVRIAGLTFEFEDDR